MRPNFGHLRWKTRLNEQRSALAASDALALTGVAQSTAEAAQSTADTGVTNAGTAQTTADSALNLATAADSKAASANAATAALTPATQVAMPVIQFAGGNSFILTCATSGATIMYRVGFGSFAAYSGSFTVLAGQSCEAYATKGGMTDSDLMVYERN